MVKKYLLIITLILFSSNCEMMKQATLKDSGVDKVVYRFIDSSVPPQYHRSYSIEVDLKQIRLVVDSYGDILNDQSFESNPAVFKKALAAFHEAQLKKGPLKDNPGCTGGTSEKVLLLSGTQTHFSAYTYHCQGSWGDLQGNIKLFGDEMKALVPDLRAILQRLQ